MIRFALAAVLALASSFTFAQVPQVPYSATLTWQLPTTAEDNSPLTGAAALTRLEVITAAAPIPDTATAPVVSVAPSAASYVATGTIANGGTFHARIRACNASGCGVWSNQATRAISVSRPNAPGNLTVTVTVTIAP